MKIEFYKIECLTNLHVGSGEVNYNIVDNEVEKDAVTGLPVIHASGIKGALRDTFKKILKYDDINKIFGDIGKNNIAFEGTHKFLDAILVARPMRVWMSATKASIPVVTVASVNNFIDKMNAFSANSLGLKRIPDIDFGDFSFLTSCSENISVENEKTGKLSADLLDTLAPLKTFLGSDFAIAKTFEGYDLPVIARNCLQGNSNLWYEEVVPHGSVLFFAVIYPNDTAAELAFPSVVQFGGNASIGCGFTKVTNIKAI